MEYIVAAGVCFGAIYYWQNELYTYLTLPANGFSATEVQAYSGGYFLTVALTYYFILLPVADSLIGTGTEKMKVDSTRQSSSMKWIALFLTAAFLITRALKARKVAKASAVAEKKAETETTDLNGLLDKHLNQLE